MSTALRLVRRGRRQAEQLMVDTCIIREVTGTSTDPVTGVVTATYSTVYEGKCKIQNQRPWPSNPDAGEHSWNLVSIELHLPVVGSENVETDHLVEILTSVDPVNVGRRFRIRNGDRKSLQTAIRFLVEEVTG